MTTSNVSLRSQPRLAARSFAIDGRFDLLDLYADNGFAWIDGDHGFVASGVAAVVALEHAAELLATIGHWAGADVPAGAGPRAVGALPFAAPGELVVPAVIVGRDSHGRAWRTVIDDVDAPYPVRSATREPEPSQFGVTATTTHAEWRSMVEHALTRIAQEPLEKVVLARAVRIDADRPFDIPAILAFLHRSQPGCVVYADRGFVGASPELLVRKAGATVTARPLAGTGIDPAALARSTKDAHEHQLVVDAVVHALQTRCGDVVATGPATLELADVAHLATTITAHAESTATTIADLVATLHPTPAVAGTPREIALETIDALEPVARGRYAGPCGWIDRNGDGEFVIALRGGEIDGVHAVIHAGAGIVSASDPDAEWVETQQKLTPMLQALVRP
ncbi:MAG: isochorismate synthase [Actinomycetia bacterium]|jgi:menaquinone-specific isochorismate synthase|nr:isochorismate synthase [Actinomycetes bacterium]